MVSLYVGSWNVRAARIYYMRVPVRTFSHAL
jgi:hypothetical protein